MSKVLQIWVSDESEIQITENNWTIYENVLFLWNLGENQHAHPTTEALRRWTGKSSHNNYKIWICKSSCCIPNKSQLQSCRCTMNPFLFQSITSFSLKDLIWVFKFFHILLPIYFSIISLYDKDELVRMVKMLAISNVHIYILNLNV
jgi:hypothetical protein